MKDYKPEKAGSQAASANAGSGYLIRNGGLTEEYYLQSVQKEHVRDLLLEHAYGQSPNELSRKKKGRKWKCVESLEEVTPRGSATATWTKDETKAMYFGSLKEAQQLIDRWPVLQKAKPTIIKA